MSKIYIEKNGQERIIKVLGYHRFSQNELILAQKETCCGICLDDNPSDDSSYLLTSCNHIFHAECIIKWLSADKNNTCPMCRNDSVELKTREDCIWLDQAIFDLTKNLIDLCEENPSCYLCRDQFEDNRWIELKCGHKWHHLCFTTWINKKNVCPLDNKTPNYI